ncbi:hypothetical protein A1Q1_03980 [Trichosporon asahii var. asahii CBS 2479]|uniref:EF-hand domain-containing protein n=1 Tax=Trichosporon asahii var. asahii (strain ATCC 90039 / CBS 2479 / JCM 2466 / KCTC 7840 / NBRC 103889/ NCYC 2677 / UAMH 7654) TaxID=1186058 RepID=J6F5Y9_TRIAS|nr:hypothetical protein A1Q1_03980 [Trichosporon asahii var. asahii CBS 2479]EJT52464.1 hypothetical protein A1Q1_03980 [Trichosporon asahii var. asahii CBS 2479]
MSAFPRTAARRSAPVPARPSLTEEQRNEVNEAFDLFDSDKDGFIDYHELKVALRALGFDLKKQEVLRILREHDRGNAMVAKADFEKVSVALRSTIYRQSRPSYRADQRNPAVPDISEKTMQIPEPEAVTEKILARDPLEELRRAFALFDDDKTGRISLRNLRRVAKELGEQIGDEELQAMIDEFDMDGDGEISQEEFIAIMMDGE